MLIHLVNDLRHAARRLTASPSFTAAAVATIAIGVGINTGIFSVLNGFAFRPLPVPESAEIVGIGQVIEGGEPRAYYGATIMFSTAEYRTYRDSARTLSGLVGFTTAQYVTLGGESPQQIGGALVTCNYFEVLRRPLALGPGFRPEDCDRDAAVPTVVLAHALWTTAFAADPAIVGREVILNRHSFRVVGVAAEGMRGVDLTAASWFAPIAVAPLLIPPDMDPLRDAQASWLTLLGRRAPGATLDQVQAELRVIAARIDQEQPPRKTTVLTEDGRPVARPGTRVLFVGVGSVVMGAFGMVLLIACANVANLLLARATGRSAEIAVRLSLGASRGRIVQQLLAESAWIAALGGALGSLLALASFRGVLAFAMTALPPGTPELTIDTGPDARVLGYALALTLAAGMLFGLLPALRASKRDLHTAMKGASPAGHGSGSRLQGTLVGVQVAVCIVLTVAASLLLRGLFATHSAEPGFRYENVVVADVDFGGYDAPREAALQRELTERVGALPGVEAVAHVVLPPLSEGNMTIRGGLPEWEQLVPFGVNDVSADYFSLLEIPLVRGRAFTAADETDTSTAAIVTEATARQFWPGREAIGQKLALAEPDGQQRREVEIVGVARDAEILGVGEIPPAYVYLPAARTQRGLKLLAKTRGDYAGTAAGVRAAVAALDPGLVVRVAPLEANLDIWRSLARVVSTLAASLGAVALALAVVGVYGMVAHSVGRRVREIGVRIALGARRADVVALVLRKTMRPVIVGAAIGVLAGVGVSRLLSGVLFGVSPTDPAALAVALLVVLGGAVAAGVVPARRASRLDPNAVLHHD